MKIIIFNWKSYLDFSETLSLTKTIAKSKISKKYKIIIAPNSIFLVFLNRLFKKLSFASQNFDTHGRGGFTSYTSVSDLRSVNIRYSLIGHSEVRSFSGEDDKLVNYKVNLSHESKIIPIICVGEDLKTYKSNKTMEFLKKQLYFIFNKKFNYNEIIIAYEPLWSIGSGLVPSSDEIEKIIGFIRYALKDYSFKKLKILYGGSVNSDNLSKLSRITKLDGFLIGSASIQKSFIKNFKT